MAPSHMLFLADAQPTEVEKAADEYRTVQQDCTTFVSSARVGCDPLRG